MGERSQRRAVRGERASQAADFLSLCDESFDVLLGAVATHRLDVELLEALLQPLERPRVGGEDPFQQGGEEGRTVEHAGAARARDPLRELIQHRDRAIMRGDHPVLSDDTLERDEVSFLVVAGRVRRDVDVAAVVVEDSSPRG